MLHIELYGSINYDPCLGSSVRFSAAPSQCSHRRTQHHLWLCIAYLRDRNQDLWLSPTAHSPVSEVINFSSSRCGDGDPGAMGRGSQALMSVMCMMQRWHRDDPGWWHMVTGPPLISSGPSGDLHTALWPLGWLQDTQGWDHIPSELEMVPGSASFILLSLPGLLSHPPGVIQLVHNHNERRVRVTHHSREGK